MKKSIFIIIICFFLFCSNASCIEDESHLIRRAYIDVLKIVPTQDEIDWYCTYNKNSYEVAVDWILQQKNYSKKFNKKILLSENYKKSPKQLISSTDLIKIIMYIAGDAEKQQNDENLNKSIQKILKISRDNTNTDIDAIDDLCMKLMCRSSNLNEANLLLNTLKDLLKNKSEEQAWTILFYKILDLKDVKNK